jgi:hypothetical protein
MLAVGDTVKFVNNCPTRVLAVVIHTGNIQEQIETQILLGKFANLGDLLRVSDVQREFAAKLRRRGDEVSELFA